MENLKEHELLISYYEKRIAELPHGHFGIYRTRPVVYVTYDPLDGSINAYNKKRLYTDTANGECYAVLISEYQDLCNKLNALTEEWNLICKCAPRKLKYPLKKTVRSIFTSEFFDSAAEGANPIPIEHPIEYKGHLLRSKNEMLGCIILEKFGYEYKIEIAVGNDPFGMLYPDITFKVPEQERCIGIEINGALDRIKYANRSVNRHKGYLDLGLRISKDIIFVDIADASSFYADVFETQVKLAVMAGIDDIVFPPGFISGWKE